MYTDVSTTWLHHTEISQAWPTALALGARDQRFKSSISDHRLLVFSKDREMVNKVPAIGRIVHYVSYGTPGGEYKPGKHRSAIITAVYSRDGELGSDPTGPEDVSSTVGICVLNPTGAFFHEFCPYDPEARAGSWHWPEFAPSQLSIGDKVKFIYSGIEYPAIVVNVDSKATFEDEVFSGQTLAVFTEMEGPIVVIAQFSDTHEEGTWHW